MVSCLTLFINKQGYCILNNYLSIFSSLEPMVPTTYRTLSILFASFGYESIIRSY